MKKLLILCAAFMLLFTACTAPAASPTSTASTSTTAAETPAATEPAPPVLFTVTDQTLLPPAQTFDAAFAAFYETFKAAVRDKNMSFIDSILDDEVRSSFGGDPGKADFRAHWDDNPDLWIELEKIIALGGRYYQENEYAPEFGKCFVAPYVFTDFDEGLDAFEHFAVIDKDVPVYKEASTASEVIATLNYNIVKFHNDSSFWDTAPDAFVGMTVPSGAVGYVQKKNLRSPMDYRLCLTQKDDGWKLLWLIAGD